MKRVITFGTFDLLHEGHLRILERAKARGDYLIVGVSTDRLNAEKGKRSFFDQEHRRKCVAALACVDEVFFEDSLEKKDEYIREHRANVLVMGDDWQGKFDWVSCEVAYLPRTEGVSSTEVKASIGERFKPLRVLFGDTYLKKHYDCALSLVNEMTGANMAPILTQAKTLPPGIDCDCIVYFNLPVNAPAGEYESKPRILVDHGASNLKWFLANQRRFDFFDIIITAGPDHTRSLLTFFPNASDGKGKVRSAGFIKSKQLLGPPLRTRAEVCAGYNLDPLKPIVLFVPTWYITNNRDIAVAIELVAEIENHVAVLHPETAHINTSKLNVAANENGILTELLKHADCVVSELSSTIFEAAALGKPIVQILLAEYSDNNASMFDFPYSAGTSELFCGGLPCRPQEVKAAVERVLSGSVEVSAALAGMRGRILRGTSIVDDSSVAIVDEIARACQLTTAALTTARTTRNHSVATHALAHENLLFSRNTMIACGGGRWEQYGPSSSKEALQGMLAGLDFVELDFTLASDGVHVADGGSGARYGIDGPLKDVTTLEFLSRKFDGMLTPIGAAEAVSVAKSGRKVVVCNVVGEDEDYAAVLKTLHGVAADAGAIKHVVVECGDLHELNTALRAGFVRVILDVGRHYGDDPLGDAAFEFLRAAMAIEPSEVVGIKIPYIGGYEGASTIQDSRSLALFQFWRRIYVQGAPVGEYGKILNGNFGLFAEGYSAKFQFQHTPPGFAWREYLFLNPDVAAAGHANQVGAVLHYLHYGHSEGRVLRYSVPPDFTQAIYVDMNPVLRTTGISGENTAKAHWTKYGEKEGRKYKRN
ncbi:adenylyltransferase/cytidyltransferase family protein [Pseudoxanthomonas sp. PXM03]|uniref:adenylyltransferase/cytidyltransferase family protein n=1 Tax=Pseudoxanthomonas sp. PXM03 TaxID=2769284 RepID=UPI0017816733|nr:adenylyltransferase/cytidyltransferase family protein [Pseudoxanthomonas sp. PXM03]MBD9436741.1 adenylyltransferase/cytidyltransferase family protein [Pseudoxanthomonas sp. PXM03]